MRLTFAASLAVLLSTATGQSTEPFVPVGVWYDAGSLPALAVLRDLQSIRALGFNHLRVPVVWKTAEKARGTYELGSLDRLLSLADQTELKVIVQAAMSPPAWLEAHPVDERVVTTFLDVLSARAPAHRSFHAVEPDVSPFRVSVHPRPASDPPWTPVQLTWHLDVIRSAAGDRGWRLTELQAGPARTVSGADLRFWGWAALARGARSITYDAWSAASAASFSRPGLLDDDGAISERARAAGAFAGVVSRNAALFAPLRPRPSRAAILDHPAAETPQNEAEALARRAARDFYSRAFDRNIQTDIIRADDVLAGRASNYKALLVGAPDLLPTAVTDILLRYERQGGTVIRDPHVSLGDVAVLQPEVRIEGGDGLVEARFLESADALVLIALNHGDRASEVQFTFTADTPEAIWQNMESGASVSFVRSARGLTHRHAFAARDALVLMIRKRLR